MVFIKHQIVQTFERRRSNVSKSWSNLYLLSCAFYIQLDTLMSCAISLLYDKRLTSRGTAVAQFQPSVVHSENRLVYWPAVTAWPQVVLCGTVCLIIDIKNYVNERLCIYMQLTCSVTLRRGQSRAPLKYAPKSVTMHFNT